MSVPIASPSLTQDLCDSWPESCDAPAQLNESHLRVLIALLESDAVRPTDEVIWGREPIYEMGKSTTYKPAGSSPLHERIHAYFEPAPGIELAYMTGTQAQLLDRAFPGIFARPRPGGDPEKPWCFELLDRWFEDEDKRASTRRSLDYQGTQTEEANAFVLEMFRLARLTPQQWTALAGQQAFQRLWQLNIREAAETLASEMPVLWHARDERGVPLLAAAVSGRIWERVLAAGIDPLVDDFWRELLPKKITGMPAHGSLRSAIETWILDLPEAVVQANPKLKKVCGEVLDIRWEHLLDKNPVNGVQNVAVGARYWMESPSTKKEGHQELPKWFLWVFKQERLRTSEPTDWFDVNLERWNKLQKLVEPQLWERAPQELVMLAQWLSGQMHRWKSLMQGPKQLRHLPECVNGRWEGPKPLVELVQEVPPPETFQVFAGPYAPSLEALLEKTFKGWGWPLAQWRVKARENALAAILPVAAPEQVKRPRF